MPTVPAELLAVLQQVLVAFGSSVDASKMLSTWAGWPVAINLANYMAKTVPAMKKQAYEFKSELMRLAVPLQPPGLGWDPTDGGAYRWKVSELPGAPQIGLHSCSTRGSENLPVVAWEGTRWQNEDGCKKLLAYWQSKPCLHCVSPIPENQSFCSEFCETAHDRAAYEEGL